MPEGGRAFLGQTSVCNTSTHCSFLRSGVTGVASLLAAPPGSVPASVYVSMNSIPVCVVADERATQEATVRPSMHAALHCACHVACEGRPWPRYMALSPPLQELIHENMPEMGTESRGLLSSVVWSNHCHQDSTAGAGGRRVGVLHLLSVEGPSWGQNVCFSLV